MERFIASYRSVPSYGFFHRKTPSRAPTLSKVPSFFDSATAGRGRTSSYPRGISADERSRPGSPWRRDLGRLVERFRSSDPISRRIHFRFQMGWRGAPSRRFLEGAFREKSLRFATGWKGRPRERLVCHRVRVVRSPNAMASLQKSTRGISSKKTIVVKIPRPSSIPRPQVGSVAGIGARSPRLRGRRPGRARRARVSFSRRKRCPGSGPLLVFVFFVYLERLLSRSCLRCTSSTCLPSSSFRSRSCRRRR